MCTYMFFLIQLLSKLSFESITESPLPNRIWTTMPTLSSRFAGSPTSDEDMTTLVTVSLT